MTRTIITLRTYFQALVIVVELVTFDARSQGTFLNLNFESANVPDVPQGQFGGFVPVGEGVPGWTAYIGANQVGSIRHNDFALGDASLQILGPQWFPSQILEGSYSVGLQASFDGLTSAAIAQSGLIPQSAKSLVFFSSPTYSFQVSLSGQVIPLVEVGAGTNYIILGGDVSQFAGQMRELRFSGVPGGGGLPSGGGILDNIQFSPQAIPEPAVASLFGAGVALLGWRTTRNRLKR